MLIQANHMHLQSTLATWLALRQQHTCHRQLLVVSGDQTWGKQQVANILHQLQHHGASANNAPQMLTVGRDQLGSSTAAKTICNSEYRQFLGQETDVLVYNTWCGFRANALLALVGTIRYAGLMILLCPEFEDWPKRVDPELSQRISYGAVDTFHESVFTTRLIQQLQAQPHAALLTQRQFTGKAALISHPVLGSRATLGKRPPQAIQATSEQRAVVEEIARLASKPRHGSIIIQADRGRGKSTAIGLACAQIASQTSQRLVLTAPHRQCCQQTFAAYQTILAAATNPIQGSLTFMAFDKLLEQPQQLDMLIIDEAAALPTAILASLLDAYPKTVYSTTVQGYEGSGNGFELRFLPILRKRRRHLALVSLNTPVRWEPDDPLELFWFDIFCYQSLRSRQQGHIAKVPAADLSAACGGSQTSISHTLVSAAVPVAYTLVSKRTLLQQPKLLTQIFELLIDAHYQTTPDVLVAMLDAPEQQVFIATKDALVVAAAIVSIEGGQPLRPLSEAIALGQRRVNGHLLPQRLGFALNQAELVTFRYLRVVRLATRTHHTRQGIARGLLASVMAWGSNQHMQFIGATFGAEAGLLQFWHQCGFEFVHLGTKKETSTGLYTATCLRLMPTKSDVNDEFWPVITQLQAGLTSALQYHYCGLLQRTDPHLVLTFVITLKPQVELTKQEFDQLDHFAKRHRTLLMTLPAISKLANHADIYRHLSPHQSKLLIAKILQKTPDQALTAMGWCSGKKDLETQLADIVQLALVPLCDNTP